MRARGAIGLALGGAVALAAVGGGVVVVRGVLRMQRALHPTRVHVSREAEAQAFAEVPGLGPVTLKTSDGLTLRGWFTPGTRRTAVIVVHGGFENRLQLFPDARLLARHGYGVLVYDARASGESDGDLLTYGDREQHDVAAAIDFVAARREIDPKKIALIGLSIGGSSVAMQAARDPRVAAVILYATWTSLEDEMRQNNRKYGPLSWQPVLSTLRRSGVELGNVRPIDHIAEIAPRPLLMITGTRDDDTPVPVMQRLFAAARAPKDLWIVEGAGHGNYLATAPAEYERRVIGFLDRSVGTE